MFNKVIGIGSWPGLCDNPVHMIKVSSRGLIGNDRSDFLKIASHVFADAIDNVKLASGDVPIHLTAIGATEAYGCNRNGDGFKEAYCQQYHPRFVKEARYYRNHVNKDPAKSYGCVKLSDYNQPMRRIELLVLGNGDKEACERNGGLLMEKSSIDKLARGEMLPFSMACKVAHDVCSNCFNKAANRSEYCTAETCINPQTGRRGFGCADGLAKVASDGFQQYVENPDPHFFDISEVFRPADRIAYGGTADYMQKAASASMGGAELAELWARQGATFDLMGPTETIFNKKIARQIKLARELADVERQLESNWTDRENAWARALAPKSGINLEKLGSVGSSHLSSALKALAMSKIALPLGDFLSLIAGDDREKLAALSDSVPRHLPGIFGRLSTDPNLESLLRANPFSPSEKQASAEHREWAASLEIGHSLAPASAQERVVRSVFSKDAQPKRLDTASFIKTAATDEPAEQAARQYALYKLAMLDSIPLNDPSTVKSWSDIKQLAVCSHYVS